MSQEEVLENSVREIDVESIRVNRYQPRMEVDQEGIDELANSIKSVGLIQPPVVRIVKGTSIFELIAGERRYRAAKAAGLTKIPVIIRDVSDQKSAQAALIENVQRVDLNPIEIAKALRNLIGEFGYSQEELAEKIGKKRSTVSNYLRLLSLPRGIQKSISDNKISMGHAKAILSLKETKDRVKFFDKLVKERMTVRQAEEYLVRAKEKQEGQEGEGSVSSLKKAPILQKCEEGLRKRYGKKVLVRGNKDKGSIQFIYESHEELVAIVKQLSGVKALS